MMLLQILQGALEQHIHIKVGLDDEIIVRCEPKTRRLYWCVPYLVKFKRACYKTHCWLNTAIKTRVRIWCTVFINH